MYVPFCPMPVRKAKKLLGNKLYGIAEPFVKMSPSLNLELRQAGFNMGPLDYMSIAFFSSIFMFFMMSFVFFFITLLVVSLLMSAIISLLVGTLFGFVTLFYIRAYPKLLVKKKIFDVERNLLYALRHMYVQVTSGVPLYDVIVSVARGNYGKISSEFKSAIRMMNTGVSIDESLEDLTMRNPSMYFRRAMWQISNGVKAGSDIGDILKNTIDYVSAEQKILIRRYGSQLSPLTVAYMMVAVVIPSLGVTFLMVISSFANIPVTETTFWGIVAFAAIFQFMFLGMLKSKRPNIL